MSMLEQIQLQINEVLGAALHVGSSTSSQIALNLGFF